jgi:hypothetical protein
VEAQTARNLEGLAAEAAGEIDLAISLYERTVSEGFVGDLPYGRLVALYGRRGSHADAERVLLRAIEVYSTAATRTPADRRATLRVFKNRLTEVRKALRQAIPKASVSKNVGRRQRVHHDQQQGGAEHGDNDADRLDPDHVQP